VVGATAAPDEVIGEIEEACRGGVAIGQVPSQPKHFRQFHLDADFPRHVGQRRIARRVDRRRLVARAVIHPHDDVAFGLAAGGNRDRLAGAADGDSEQVASKPSAADRTLARHRRASRPRARRRRSGSRCRRRLLDDAGGGMELPDGPHGEGETPPREIEDTRPDAGRSHIHADDVPRCLHGQLPAAGSEL